VRNGLRPGAIRSLACVLAVTVLLADGAAALTIRNHYSPKNGQRALRKSTPFILLHTTEGPSKGSLSKVRQNGEAHYFIDEAGVVYRVIHQNRVAYHAGRSMWDGRTNLDLYSLGIEIAGYHDRGITQAQYGAARELLAELQRVYNVPDERILTHSMVAYGAPNRWHKKSHRGRKRCGMLFAKHSVRGRLGLTKKPLEDPDVKAGRLVVADRYLANVLYSTAGQQPTVAGLMQGSLGNVIQAGRSAWDIARDRYRSSEVTYIFPDGRKMAGNTISNWKKIPVGTRVVDSGNQSDNETEKVLEIGVDGATARDIAGDEYSAETTVYFLPNGRVRKGSEMTADELLALLGGTQMLVGYVSGGKITTTRSAFDICGETWCGAMTFYRFPDGTVHSGDTVNEKAIPRGTLIFFRN